MRTIILLSFLAFAARTAAADVVLAVDNGDIYIDLGARDGVGAGTQLELLHEVVAKDPRTGATLKDSFALGSLTVTKAGDKLCVAQADPDLAKRVLAGDRVRLVGAPRKFMDPWAAQVEASRVISGSAPPVAPTVPEQVALDHVKLAEAAWRDTLGKSPEQRLQRWSELLTADPKTPYRRVIENELQSLRAQIQQRDDALARAKSQNTNDRNPRIARLAEELAVATNQSARPVLSVAPLPRAVPGQPLQLAFLVRMPSAIGQAWLFVRPPGEPGFRRLDLVHDGDSYLRATIDGAMVRTPKLEWYVEASSRGTAADVAPVLGSQEDPMSTTIDAVVEEAPIERNRSHIDVHVDYVDFDGKLNKGFDQYYQAEIDFMYRFLEPVYAVRLGFGTLSGRGGPKDVIDEDPTDQCLDAMGAYKCRNVAFSYVYTEFEFRIQSNVAFMLRPQAGLLTTDSMPGAENNRCRDAEDVEGCGFHTRFGGRARIRFGREDSTNLVIGAGFTKGVGTLLEAAYHWLPKKVIPVQLVVQVTDMPVPENFGVRLIADVGWRGVSWFYPSLRLSYQARDIDHAGFSGGLAMNFDW
ncbi:MAG: hypothetical protein H0T46_27560 [Deltaproteobacteria bacterium]|nr:hypothetical protein [Deltaproteobacteria bacterium]